ASPTQAGSASDRGVRHKPGAPEIVQLVNRRSGNQRRSAPKVTNFGAETALSTLVHDRLPEQRLTSWTISPATGPSDTSRERQRPGRPISGAPGLWQLSPRVVPGPQCGFEPGLRRLKFRVVAPGGNSRGVLLPTALAGITSAGSTRPVSLPC